MKLYKTFYEPNPFAVETYCIHADDAHTALTKLEEYFYVFYKSRIDAEAWWNSLKKVLKSNLKEVKEDVVSFYEGE